MRLVLANNPGDACVAVRSLKRQEIEALTRHFRDGIDGPWLSTWLARLNALRLWIACDCRAMHEQSPMFFVRRASRESYALARMPDRPAHHATCPFLGRAAHVQNAEMPAASAPLLRLMNRWFAAARLNVVFPYALDDCLSAQYAALREVSRSMELGRGQRLFDFSRTHPRGLPELCRRLRRSGQETEGVYLTVSSSLDPAELRDAVRDNEGSEYLAEEELPAARCANGAELVHGPFVVLALLAGGQGIVRIREVLAQPVHSQRLLVPLDGATDRRTLEVLLEVQRMLLTDWGLIIAIRKTLCDAAAHERGVSFHVQRLGPNGRALQSIDVLGADAGMAFYDGVDLEQVSDPLYHAVGPTEGPFTPTDASFRNRVLSRLLSEAADAGARPTGRSLSKALAS